MPYVWKSAQKTRKFYNRLKVKLPLGRMRALRDSRVWIGQVYPGLGVQTLLAFPILGIGPKCKYP